MARPEVRLIYAKVIDRYPHVGSTGFDYVYGRVETDNLSPDTQVSVLYSYRIGKQQWNEWREETAKCVGPDEGSDVYWEFRTQRVDLYSPRGTVEFQLAIKCAMNERTYWDNNGRKNYFLGAGENPHYPSLLLPYGRVFLNSAGATHVGDVGMSFVGSIAARSVSGKREIEIVFTTDNWRSMQKVYAKYARDVHYGTGVEIWEFSTIVQENATEISWAIAYVSEEGTSWDNNFGKDYVVKVPGRMEPGMQ